MQSVVSRPWELRGGNIAERRQATSLPPHHEGFTHLLLTCGERAALILSALAASSLFFLDVIVTNCKHAQVIDSYAKRDLYRKIVSPTCNNNRKLLYLETFD